MAKDFAGRVAIVTGAGTGLGRNYALALAQRGARVLVNDLGPLTDGIRGASPAADSLAAEIRAAGGEVLVSGADVARADEVEAMVTQALAAWDKVDILINNAGNLRDRTFAKMTLEDFRAVLEVHLMGSVHCAKAVWETMRANNYGRIVLTSSSAGVYGNFGQANYASAKMALVGLMNTLHLEGRRNDIRVNTLTPTAATAAMADLSAGHIPDQHLEMLDPAAITPALLFLVGAEAPTRTILSAGAGGYSRVVIHETRGVWLPPAERTPEGLAAQFAALSDIAGSEALEDAYQQVDRHLQRAAVAQGFQLEGHS